MIKISEEKRRPGRPRKHPHKESVEVVNLVPAMTIQDAETGLQYDKQALYSPEVTNSKIAAFTYEIMKISRKANLDNVDSLYDCFSEYLQLCSNTGMKISNMMAYTACGVSKQLIDYWNQGKQRSSDPRYKEFARLVKSICAANREQLATEGKINPVFAIWQQKCHDGFRDNEIIMLPEEKERTKSSAEILKEFSDL